MESDTVPFVFGIPASDVRCAECRDGEVGPWGIRDGEFVCESCLGGAA